MGARIKAARTAAGLTQPELGGEQASVAYVSRIERGERRAGVALLEGFAERLGVSLDYLVLGRSADDVRRLALHLDHAELALKGGDAAQALDLARVALIDPGRDALPETETRARWVEAAALDALGDPAAVAAYEAFLARAPKGPDALRAATAMSRILREAGELDRSVAVARAALDALPPDLAASEEAVRLSVTLAAALFESGEVAEAARVCDVAIVDAERLSSPVARASAYWNASVIHSNAGEIGPALELARRALGLLEGTERVRDLGRLRLQLSHIMLDSDPPRVEEARAQLAVAERELDWSEASPTDRSHHAYVVARAAHLAGDLDDARGRSQRVLDELGDELTPLRAQVLALLGQVEWASGDAGAAHAAYHRAIAVLTAIGSDRRAAQLWFEIGALADEAGMVAEARDAYRRAAASAGVTPRARAAARRVADVT
nr:helix-turn-helix domain-containing protein [Nocardioides flavescens]